MAKFNWKSDGEEAWNESDWEKESSPGRPGRRWLIFLAFLFLASTAGVVIYRQIGARLDAATSAVTEDLMSSYRLTWYAVAQGDSELFDTLLSGRDSRWTQTERQLFSQAILYDRAFWGLSLNNSATQPDALARSSQAPADIRFSPDLLEAEIVTALPYTVTTPAGTSQQVILQHSAIFRRGQERWLLAPPGDDYWGGRVRHEGTWLTLDYARRDAEVASRLASDLDDQLGRLCRQVAHLECPQDMRVILRLDTDPESLLFAARTATNYPNLHLVLPTIGLVGVPENEAGYQALYRAYARQLVAAVVAQQVEWQCCVHTPFFEALLSSQFSQLGLKPWPIDEADYLRLVDQGISMEELGRIWFVPVLNELDQEQQRQVYVLVDFLLETFPQQSAADMQRQLVSQRTLGEWLRELYAGLLASDGSADEQIETRLQDAWRQVAYQKAIAAQGPTPIPLPTQEIRALCFDQDAPEEFGVYRYLFISQDWTRVTIDPVPTLLMSALPDDSGILTSSYVYDGGNEARGRWQSVLWRAQTSTSLFSNRESVFSLGQMDPSGRYVVAYSMNSEGDQIQARLVDLSDCDASECSSTPIAGPAVWSPDGRHTLVTEIGSLGQSPLVVNGRTWWFPGAPANLAWRIYLGDEQALDRAQPAILTELGVGRGPFWLDETTFGYLRDVPESSFFPAQELVVASVTNGIPEVILNSASLAEALSGDGGQDDWLIQVVAASPLDPELLFLYVTTTRRGTGSQLVAFDKRTGRIETRLNLFNYDFGSLGFSPDGRWLILVGSGNSQLSAANDQTTLFLHDISRNQTKMLPVAVPGFPTSGVYDWSIDGRWLLIVIDEQLLGLVAPEQDYQRYLLTEAGGACAAVAWIGP